MGGDLIPDEVFKSGGAEVFSVEGELLGAVEVIYADPDRWTLGPVRPGFRPLECYLPEWLIVGAPAPAGGRFVVPVAGAEFRDGAIHVPYTADHVRGSPLIDGESVAVDVERALYEHFGIRESEDVLGVFYDEEDFKARTSPVEVTRERLRIARKESKSEGTAP